MAFAEAGARAGDRIEHAAVAPPDVVALVAALPLTVVTQPGFIRERGDAGELGASLRYLGATYQARNAFSAAEEQYVRAQPLLEAALGSGDFDYGFFLRDLGQVYAAQNKLVMAEDAYGRSLSILEAQLGAQDPMVIETRKSYEQVLRARTTP